MKIKSCEIKDFGKLSDRTVEFGDGINVIRGRNESGKSTLSHFIKYAFYGFYGKGRDETGNEKTKFSPWSGKKASGALVLEREDGEVFRVERSADTRGAKCKIYDSAMDICYDGEEAGSVFFGMDVCAFSKSAFIGQDDVSPDDMKDLGAVLEKLIMRSDDEDTDCDKAIKSLTSTGNKLMSKTGTSGKIPELSALLTSLCQRRESASEKYRILASSELSASETEKKLSECESRLERLYSEAENISAYKASEMLERLNEAKEKSDRSEEIYRETAEKSAINGFIPDRRFLDELTRTYSDYIASVPDCISSKSNLDDAKEEHDRLLATLYEGNGFKGSAEEVGQTVNGLCEKADELCAKAKRLKTLAIVFLCLVLTIPISVVLFILHSKKKKELSNLLGEYGIPDVKALLEYRKKYERVCEELKAAKRNISDKTAIYESSRIKCAASEELLYTSLMKIGYADSRDKVAQCTEIIKDSLIPKIRNDVYETETAYSVYKEHLNAYNALSSVSNRAELEALAAKKQSEPPKRAKEDVDTAIRYDEGARALLSKKLSELRAEIARMGAVTEDPADIRNEVCRVEAELEDAKKEQKAIALAVQLLTEARDGIRGNIFPQVSKRASELFAKFTDGKYRALYFDKEFTVKVLEGGDTETRSAGFLSSGTADAAYIALRIALSEVLSESKPPIIFDDSFAKMDSARLERILDVLNSLSSEYQIIILTCHDREEKMLEGKCRAIAFDE
ncbi:MAG: AAA family ATPase [Clostridia bacterium]|nr:AAA family ATPase [Clostridia bacterium]